MKQSELEQAISYAISCVEFRDYTIKIIDDRCKKMYEMLQDFNNKLVNKEIEIIERTNK